MFIKISENFYINSDHVVFVEPSGKLHLNCIVRPNRTLPASRVVSTSAQYAAYFLACVEAQSALATEKAEPPSLKSRIAQALRWDFPQGALLKYLVDFLALPCGKQPSEEDEAQVNTALNELMIEGVVTNIGLYYYHAANAPKPSPDPSNATAETNSIPAESTAPIQDPNSVD